MTNKQRIEGVLTRAFFKNAAIINAEERLIRVSFSSEEPYTRASYFSEPWVEILGHEESEVDLTRLNNGAPVLYNHSRSGKDRIGVVERAWLQDRRTYADVRISKRAEVDGIWQDIVDGILCNTSTAYSINERTLLKENKDKPSEYRVTRWTPMEISLVDIPADHTVGVGRVDENPMLYRVINLQSSTFKENTTMPEATVENNNPEPVNAEAVRAEAMRQEQGRRKEIRAVFTPFGDQHRALMDGCLDDTNMTVEVARKSLLEALGKGREPQGSDITIRMGETEVEKFHRAVEDALEVRSGMKGDSGSNEFRGFTLLELARHSLEIRGVATKRMDKLEMVGRAFTHTSSDFPLLLANSARKAMLKGYTETEEVFDRFTSVGNLADFKTNDRVNMSEFGGLSEIPEGAEYTYASMGENREQIKLATYGKMFAITRQAIINDDLQAFTTIPRKMGRAAKRKVGDLVWSILTSNPNMADGVALFHANHANLAATGTALAVASGGAARSAMRLQKDSSGNAVLNIAPTYLLAPVALEDTANVLMSSETDFSSGNSRKPNPLRNAFDVITDARLDAVSTTAWYLAADPNAFDVIEVGYLDGNPNPYLEEQNGWNVDGVEMKVRIDAASKALDWRTLYKNPGA